MKERNRLHAALRRPSKGNRVNIPEPEGGYFLALGSGAVTLANRETSAGAPGRVVFSF